MNISSSRLLAGVHSNIILYLASDTTFPTKLPVLFNTYCFRPYNLNLLLSTASSTSPYVHPPFDLYCFTQMAAVIIAFGAAIAFTAKKIHDRKEKKRAPKVQDALQHGSIEEVEIIDNTTADGPMEDLPTYQKEKLPAYHKRDQHPVLQTSKQSVNLPY
jgi:hypothetical protein